MQSLLGDDYPAFLATCDEPPATALRVNTLKTTPAGLLSRLPFDLTPLPWSAGAFLLSGPVPGALGTDGAAQPEPPRPGKHPYHAAGLYYLQDPASLAPVELLQPQPGETILDLSAAPGGKATHIAARMQGAGLLIANEVVHKRAWELAGNLERWGATNVAITTETPERLAARWPGVFDAVLVDAPCSGEGMFRRSEAARRAWSPALVAGCAARQDGILEHAARLVRPGGRLVYSTCTFAPEENEGTVARFLQQHPDFSLVPPPASQSSIFTPGRPDWLPDDLQRPDLVNCVRLWPHTGPGEGHFAALLQRDRSARDAAAPAPRAAGPTRNFQTATLGQPSWPNLQSPPRAVRDQFTAFLRTQLTFGQPHLEHPERSGGGAAAQPKDNLQSPIVPQSASLALVGSYVYALPPGLPDLTGLRFLHPGWWLGEAKRGRFEPSHALALALRSAAPAPHEPDAQPSTFNLQPSIAAPIRRAANFAPNDPRLVSYLRGETVDHPGEDGWTLVTVDEFGIGWAKRVAGRLKSHYPKGLRWLA